MELENEDIAIDLDDEAPGKPAEEEVFVEKKEEAKPAADAPAVEEAMEDLKRQLAEKEERLAAAEQRATSAAQLAHQQSTRAHESDLQLVTNAIGQIEQVQPVLQANYARALAEQDFDEAAQIQVAMTRNETNLAQLRQGKSSLEGAAPAAPIVDPVEALASQLSPRSAGWVRSHPEYARDPSKYQKMLGAHNMAMADGYAVDSDAYFEHVEGLLGIRQASTRQDDDVAATVTGGRTAAPPSAPVSRGGGGTGSGNPNRVTLSKEEREIAALNGMTDQEYARQKLALQREGKLH